MGHSQTEKRAIGYVSLQQPQEFQTPPKNKIFKNYSKNKLNGNIGK